MMQTWASLVRTQEILRPLHVRQIHLAGLGQPLDPPLWPIIDRLWALGCPLWAPARVMISRMGPLSVFSIDPRGIRHRFAGGTVWWRRFCNP